MNQFDLAFEKKNIIIKNAIKFCHDYVIFKYKYFVDKQHKPLKLRMSKVYILYILYRLVNT